MDGEDLQLLIEFVVRQKRFLRSLETSFTPRELESGRRILKNALRAARKERSRMGSRVFDEHLSTQAGRGRLAERVALESRQPLTKKHAFLLLENFELFKQVMSGAPAAKPKPEENPEAPQLFAAVDRFYSPVARAYK